LPRFVQEGKKYASIAIGCTGGRHRSVYLVERLASYLAARIVEREAGWRLHVAHRELAREGLNAAYLVDRPTPRRETADHQVAEERPNDVDAAEGKAYGGSLY
jgi:UPF0042 nucleotide-binding protein